jgi:hypothetical protein
MFPKPDLVPSSGQGWETPTLLGSLERSNHNNWTEKSSSGSKNSSQGGWDYQDMYIVDRIR